MSNSTTQRDISSMASTYSGRQNRKKSTQECKPLPRLLIHQNSNSQLYLAVVQIPGSRLRCASPLKSNGLLLVRLPTTEKISQEFVDNFWDYQQNWLNCSRSHNGKSSFERFPDHDPDMDDSKKFNDDL